MRIVRFIPVAPPTTGRRPSREFIPGLPFSRFEERAEASSAALGLSPRIQTENVDPSFALDVGRNQYFSTSILQRLAGLGTMPGESIVGITPLDLFVPILTFVFGEAQLEGQAALVSIKRLHQEFYGLPPEDDLLLDRLEKEILHEMGHTLGLHHCQNWECVMASTHSVERLDIRSNRFCSSCEQFLPASCRVLD
jgi:archaemetzincin